MPKGLRKMKVLLVEPKEYFGPKLKGVFTKKSPLSFACRSYEYDFEVVSSLGKAIPYYKLNHPDLVIVDLSLGESDCRELCEFIRKQEGNRHTGIIFLGLNVENEDDKSIEFLEMGADDVIRGSCPALEIKARVNAVLRFKAMTDQLRTANHKLNRMINTDDLTGLNNMRSFNNLYSKAFKDCLAGKCDLAVIMIDLDHFKMVNDTTNHLMGSHVISQVGKLISGSKILGPMDCPARFGGDEYVVFTRGDSFEELRNKAEKLRHAIRRGVFLKDGFSVRVTASFGCAWIPSGSKEIEAEDLIKAADMMLYLSKNHGRNRVSSMILEKSIDLNDLGVQLKYDDSIDFNLPKKSKARSA